MITLNNNNNKNTNKNNDIESININSNEINSFDFSRANWNKFSNNLEQIDFQQILSSSNVDEINEFIIKKHK
jgi:t-SNARE complex subunit (syntaxin)